MRATRPTSERWILVLVCSLLMALQPALGTPPAGAIGRVSGRGPVLLNGVAAPVGANVYAGNRIATGRRAAAYVVLAQGGELVLGGSTVARITQNARGFSVNLDHGVVGAVSDSRVPVIIKARGVTIRSKQTSGAYQVALNGRMLRVLARQRGTLVEASNRTVEVAPGKLMEANAVPKESLSKKGKA